MLNHALKYVSMGLSVIPLKPHGKEPLYSWKDYQKRRATEQEVRQWWTTVPNANIGIVTGKISNLAVIDLDGLEGLKSASELRLTSSVISLTGNGKHLWYRNAGATVQNAVRTYPGIDIRGEGGYVVAPPSVSSNGRRYRWLSALNAQNVSTLPLFPAQIFAETASLTKKFEEKEDSWIATALQEMKNGNIDDTLTSVLGRLRHDGYSNDDARILLAPHAERAGATPGHLEEKIKNVWSRYDAAKTRVEERIGSTERLVIHSPSNPDSIKQFEQRHILEGSTSGLRTGYTKLDSMFRGGLKSSRLFTIAARTGVGKTNWLLAAIKHLCGAGKRVLLFSTEMPYEEIWSRYRAALEAPEEFKRHEFYICDSFAPNLEKVEQAITEIRPDVFMFDHINHVSEEVKGLGEFMQGLNYLKRKYDIAGIVTAQLNRAADWVDVKTGEKVIPRMSMIKGSGTIEQASSRVLLLTETKVLPEGTEIVGNLDKNDNGPKGLVHFMLKTHPYKMIEV